MSIALSFFGALPDGRSATLYTLTNASGAQLCLSDYGARIVSIRVPDRAGRLADVTLGFDSAQGYIQQDNYIGATIGRVGNRIAGSAFTLNGQAFHIQANEGPNCLHGGQNGFDRKLWQAEACEGDEGDVITFRYTSADGEEGFPGTLQVTVSMGWTHHNELSICYSAVCDKDTLCNLTNHAYFNLAGSGDITHQVLTLHADLITETDDALIPTGRELPVDGLPVDFRKGLCIGDGFANAQAYPMMAKKDGYDFNFAVSGSGMRCLGTLRDAQSGRVMHICSTEPCVQVYSGQHMDFTGHNGQHYGRHAGLALETQHHPDAVHHAAFPSVVLRAGEPYETQTVYCFGVEE